MIIEAIAVFLAGLLAGGEIIVRYGVQPALARLPGNEAIRARQMLINRLRVLVPAIMMPTVLVTVAVLMIHPGGHGAAFRWGGLAALVAFLLLAFVGTVPINIRVAGWDAEEPPDEWPQVIRRWALIDVFRSGVAVIAFGCLLASLP